MRKIELNLKNAWIDNKEITISNSYIKKPSEYLELYLFNNCIARKNLKNNETLITLCGWNSLTTRSRLNSVLNAGIYQKNFKAYFKDQELNPNQWIKL